MHQNVYAYNYFSVLPYSKMPRQSIFYFFIASLVPGRIKSFFLFDFYSVFLKLSLDMQTAPIRIYCIQSLQTEVYMRWGVGCFAEGHLGGICIFLL